MDGEPVLFHGLHERFAHFVRDEACRVPPCAPIQHVEYDVFVHKQQVTFHLVVEFVGEFNTAHVVWAWLGPFSADFARLHDFGDKLENSLGYPYSLKEPTHDMVRGMPPSDM